MAGWSRPACGELPAPAIHPLPLLTPALSSLCPVHRENKHLVKNGSGMLEPSLGAAFCHCCLLFRHTAKARVAAFLILLKETRKNLSHGRSGVYFLRCRRTTATNAEGCFLRAVVIASFSHRFSYFRGDVTIIQRVYSQGLNLPWLIGA